MWPCPCTLGQSDHRPSDQGSSHSTCCRGVPSWIEPLESYLWTIPFQGEGEGRRVAEGLDVQRDCSDGSLSIF